MLIDVQPSEVTPETLEPHPHSTIDERNLWKNNKQLSIPLMMEENATVSRSGDLELEEIKIDQENHVDMDTSEAGQSFGGEWGSPKLKENAEIGPASESMDPSEAEPSRGEPRSPSKLKEPETSGDFHEPVSSDTDNFFEKIKIYRQVVSGDMELFNRPIRLLELSPQYNSALHVAAQYKNAEMAEAIIKHDPRLMNFRNMNGDSPLHIAARVGSVEISDFLTDVMVPNMNITNEQGDTALHDAVRGVHLRVVKLLVHRHGDWTRKENEVGESPLFLAVDKWHFDIASEILKIDNCSIGGRDNMNVLHAAIIRLGQGKLPNILKILVICYVSNFHFTQLKIIYQIKI